MTDHRRILIAAIPVNIVATLTWYGLFLFMNTYAIKGLGFSNKEWTSLTLFFMGGVVFWQILSTEISSRFGRRNTIVTSLVLPAFLYPAFGYIHHPVFLGASLALLSFTATVWQVVWFPMMAEKGGDRPGYTMAMGQFIGVMVTVLVIVFGGKALAMQNYSKIFALFGGISFFCASAFYFISIPWKGHGKERVVSFTALNKNDFQKIFHGKFLWVLLAGVCIEPFNFHTANQLFPSLARDIHKLSESNISLIVGLGRLPSLLSLFIMGRWIDRTIPSRLYGSGIVVAAIGIGLCGFAGSTWGLVAGFLLFYLGHGMVWGSNSTTVNSCVERRHRDSAFSIMGVSMTLATFLTGFIHNQLIRLQIPLSGIFEICSVVAIFGGIALIVRTNCNDHEHATMRIP